MLVPSAAADALDLSREAGLEFEGVGFCEAGLGEGVGAGVEDDMLADYALDGRTCSTRSCDGDSRDIKDHGAHAKGYQL